MILNKKKISIIALLLVIIIIIVAKAFIFKNGTLKSIYNIDDFTIDHAALSDFNSSTVKDISDPIILQDLIDYVLSLDLVPVFIDSHEKSTEDLSLRLYDNTNNKHIFIDICNDSEITISYSENKTKPVNTYKVKEKLDITYIKKMFDI